MPSYCPHKTSAEKRSKSNSNSKSDSCLVIPKTIIVSQYFNNGTSVEDELKELKFDKGLLHPIAASVIENNSSRRSSDNSEEQPSAVMAGLGRRGRRSSSVHNLFLFSSAAMAVTAARKKSDEGDAASSRKSSNEHPVSSALSSKRNSCTCRKCSIFNLDDCEPKEVSSVIKYLRFRKV